MPEGTIVENPDIDPDQAAELLKASMKGFGTDEKAIIDVLVEYNIEQRLCIADVYKTKYGEDLIDGLKDELGGNFENTVVAMMTPPRLFDARELRKAMENPGTDETVLIEIMCSRSNDEIEEIKAAYAEEFPDRELEADLISETGGNFEKLLVSQCNAHRDESDEVDSDLAEAEAQEMFDAGEGTLGTDESVFNSILCRNNWSQLYETFCLYEEKAGHSIEEAISSETSGTLQEGYLALVQKAKDPSMFFADRLYNSMNGAGTDDDQLIRIMVSRSEIDLIDIQVKFMEKYEKNLCGFISDDCGGDYKRMLIALLRGN